MRMRRTRLSSVILVLVFIRTMIFICPSDDYDDLQRDWYYVSWPGFNAYQSQEAIRLIGEGVGGLVIIYFYVITREIGSCSTTKNGFKSLLLLELQRVGLPPTQNSQPLVIFRSKKSDWGSRGWLCCGADGKVTQEGWAVKTFIFGRKQFGICQQDIKNKYTWNWSLELLMYPSSQMFNYNLIWKVNTALGIFLMKLVLLEK